MLTVRHLAPLLAAVSIAEEISRDVSRRQAAIAPTVLRRPLGLQSRQEAVHAATFRAALQCLPGSGRCPDRLVQTLRAFEARLHADVDNGDLAASMLGLHCVLEGLGCIALEPPPGELARLADRAVPLRSFIRHQEEGHRRLGEVWVPRLAAGTAGLRLACEDYLALAQAVLTAGLETLDCLAGDAAYYGEAVSRHLGNVALVIHDTSRCNLEALSRE